MSLQQLYALQNQRRQNDPLSRGLSAGENAYNSAGQPRGGIGAIDMDALRNSVQGNMQQAAAQRQVLDTNALKQGAGQYPVSGTSAAAYEYLHGQRQYPTNPVTNYQPPAGQHFYGNTGTGTGAGGWTPPPAAAPALPSPLPVQRPYEQTVNVGDPTQADLANQAKNSPTKMGKKSALPQVAKPSTMSQLIGTLGPMALGYMALEKTGILGSAADYFGFGASPYAATSTQTFLPSYTATADVPAGVYTSGSTGAAPMSASETAPAAAAPAAVDVTEPLPPSVTDPAQNPYMETGPAVQVSDASAGLPEGMTVGADNAVYDAAGAKVAPSVEEYFTADAAGTSAAADATAASMSTEEAAAAAESAGLDWAAMTAEYGPYVAAALIADQVLTGGKISAGLNDYIIQPIGNAISDVASGVGDVVGGAVDTVGDVVSGAGDVVSDAWDTVTGGCFLTTAAVDHAGEKDDGEALTAMRHLRDSYLRKFPEGRREIEWYYRKAPKIVKAIDKKPNAHAIYMRMFNDFIKPTQKAVNEGNFELAHQRYNKLIGFAKRMSGLSTKEMESKTPNGVPHDIKKNFAAGGPVIGVPQQHFNLGGYSDGGRLLKGPGDGVSDSIPATIGQKRQPARLADGEFVVPARIVSELGNGSTEAGARKLYAMMDRIQADRKKSIGKGRVAVNSRADKHLPK